MQCGLKHCTTFFYFPMNHRPPTTLRHACLAFVIATTTLAQLATASASVATIDATASAPWRTDPTRRKENRPPELWRSYRHGVVDFFAKPLVVTFPKAPPPTSVDISDPIAPAPGVSVITVAGKKNFTSAPIPLSGADIEALRGKKVRFFYWMRGENIGRNPTPNSYHDAPQLYVIIKDAKGKQLSNIISHIGAIGTYPWHGYHSDIQIPSAAAKVQFQIENLHTGTAWFGRFSYEAITDQNTYSTNEKQDPDTGSLAAFPWYEPINFHFFAKPPASQYTWNFLRGPAAGMVGQPYDLTTIAGLRRYFTESVKTDLDQMNHGIMYFSSRYNFGKTAGVLPPMEDGWLAEMARLILADQDPKTGYWGTVGIEQSMSVTFHFVDMLFAFGVERTDSPAKPDPKRCITDTLPHAEQMVRSTLKLQSSHDGKLAAWSSAAYNFTDNPNQGRNRCQLGSSMNAIRLLRIARRFVDADLQQQIDTSIESAFRYMLENVITPAGLWRQTNTDAAPSKPAYWGNIVDYSRYLEPRTDATLPAPQLERLKPDTLRCSTWPERQNSIRIYLSDTKPASAADLEPKKIAAIISRGDAAVIQLDPYLAVRRMAAAARDNWGTKAFGGSNGYVYEKTFRQLPKKFPTALHDAELQLAPATISALSKGQRLYATTVDWYGRESAPVEL